LVRRVDERRIVVEDVAVSALALSTPLRPAEAVSREGAVPQTSQ
jgi:hypothetical protein